MTRYVLPFIILSATAFLAVSCASSKKNATDHYVYTIDDKALYDTIVKLDSILFSYYNTCDVNLDKHAAFYSDSIEFYHDGGGLATSKADVIGGIQKYVCGKVRRDLVKGSIEVYRIPNFGVIEMGVHKFFNSQEPNAVPHPGRFIIIWQQTKGGWKIRKVISLH
jgi:uncharacterized protein DUF4440